MASRRSHKKSRAGCRTCKKRRIKCDEVHPECNNCSSHGLSCDFAILTILPSLSAESRTALMSLNTNKSQQHHQNQIQNQNRNQYQNQSQDESQDQKQNQNPKPPNISIISPSTFSFSSSSTSSPSLPEFDTQNSFLLSSFTHPQLSPHSQLSPFPQYSPTTTPSPTTALTYSLNAKRPLESQLLYLWTTHTSKTLTIKSESGIDIWGIIVPTLGLNNAPYLMNAIYAVSALHLRSLTQSADAELQTELASASHSYIVAAISEYREILSSPTNDTVTAGNAEALFITSSLIAFYSTASRIFPSSSTGGAGTYLDYDVPLEWFLSYQGIKTIVLSSWKYLRSSPRVLPIILSQPALSLDLNSSSSSPGGGFFDSLLPSAAERQLEVQNSGHDIDAETENAYAHSIAFLNWAHQSPQRNRLMGFAATVSSRFIQLLSVRDARTMIIVACLFAMLRVVEHEVWWLAGTPEREVLGILGLLPDDEWRAKMAWAVGVVRCPAPLRDESVWGCFVKESCGKIEEEMDGTGHGENDDDDVRPHIEYLVSMIPAG